MKRNKSYYILSFLIALIFVTSCEKKLTQTPEGVLFDEEAITDFQSLQSAVIGAYNGLLDLNYYGRNYPTMLEIRGNDSYITVQNSNRLLTSFRYNYIASDPDVEGVWNTLYNIVLRANNIINRSVNVKDGDPDVINQLKGEAYFIRALAYFDLVRVFGEQYTLPGGPANLGVPVVTQFEIGNPPRSTVEDAYTFIINDLQQAEQLLPDDPTQKFRATTMAASALLARVYIYHGDNTLAIDEASKVINSGEFTLTDPTLYGSGVFWKTPGSGEEIFTIKFSQFQDRGSDNYGSLYNMASQGAYGDVRVYPDFAVSYLPGDVRANLIVQNPDDGQLYIQKFLIQDNILGMYSPKILRLAEMYFIRAEAYVKTGDPGSAADDLSAVREFRGLPDYVGTPALEDVLQEKNWEFAFEGHQWQDRLRNGLDTPRPDYQDATGLAGSDDLPVDSYKQLFPIPQRELDANTGIKNQQNPGYQ